MLATRCEVFWPRSRVDRLRSARQRVENIFRGWSSLGIATYDLAQHALSWQVNSMPRKRAHDRRRRICNRCTSMGHRPIRVDDVTSSGHEALRAADVKG